MKQRMICLGLALLLQLCGCNEKGGNEDFTQMDLPAPDRTYRESDDTFLYFYYETEPFTWVNPTGPDSELGAIAFLLPDQVESEENVRGCYMAMEGTDFSSLKGLFAYCYPPEVAASFWDFIQE